MKNKFEALAAFQQWPEDWQRLCAEYWAENDRPKGVTFTADDLKNAPCEPMSQAEIDSFKKFAKRKKVSSAKRWGDQELEWLVFCADQAKSKAQGIRDFLKRYTHRNESSCIQQLRLLNNKKKTLYKSK